MKHFFYKGKINQFEEDTLKETDLAIKLVKKEFKKVFEVRNLSFLIGSGCSLGIGGIPTMKELAESYYEPTEDVKEKMSPALKTLVLSDENKAILKEFKIDFSKAPFKHDLETFLGTLYSLKFYHEKITEKDKTENEPEAEVAEAVPVKPNLEENVGLSELEKVEKVINDTKKFILYQCLNSDNTGKDTEILDNYKDFYRKLSLRDSNLPKPNIFSTNYDLYSEKAMDELGITYTNGFSGFLERYFNPSIFNYALAEQMDISSSKWNAIDSYIYLFKIHGSVNWIEIENNNKLFKIKELQNVDYNSLSEKSNIMIYPSPIKQNASLGTPYSDLFREFQKRITKTQSVLITMGYSFCDEHINNLIYQALTIPTFRLVIFSEIGFYKGVHYDAARKNIEKLLHLNDPRIWIIGSDKEFEDNDMWNEINPNKALYFFSGIVNDLLPDWSENQIEEQNDKIIKLINPVITNKDNDD